MSSPAIDPPREALAPDRLRTQQWEHSREAREHVRDLLSGLPTGFVIFHDLQLPAPSRTVIDHIVIGPRNIWAVSTHVLAEPVTFGRGRNADTLWSGRTPLRTMLEAADWESSVIRDLIGFDVEPVMCLVAPSLPEPSFDFQGIRVSEPGALLRQVAMSTADFVDVARVADVVRRVFGAEPGAGPLTPRLGMATLSPIHRAPIRRRPRRTIGARLHSLRSVPVVRFAVLLLLVLGVVMLLPRIVGLWDSIATEGAERFTEVIDDADLDGSSSPASRPSAVQFTLTCPTPGGGWTAEWQWPGPLSDGVAGYSIRTKVDDGPPIVHTLTLWSEEAAPPPPARISSFAGTTILLDRRGLDGKVLTTTAVRVAPPTETC